MNNTKWYLALSILGGALGFIWSIIFLLLYYGQVFDAPVTDAFRIRSSAISATLIIVAVIVVWFRKYIMAQLHAALDQEGQDESE